MKIIICTAMLVSCASTAVHAATPPRAVPVTETVHGITLTDEYRWMEDLANNEEMAAWVKSESAEARKILEALPLRSAFAAKIKEVSSSLTRVSDVQMANGVTTFRRSEAGDKTAKLLVASGGKEKILFDPNLATATVAIGSVSLSPDGKLVAVHTSSGGSEVGSIQIYNTATAAKVGAPFENIWGEFGISWLGGDLVSYTIMAPAGEFADKMMGMRAYVKRLSDTGLGTLLLGPGASGPQVEPKEFPFLGYSGDKNWVVAAGFGARADNRLWVLPRDRLLDKNAKWQTLASLDDKVGFPAIYKNTAFLFSGKTNGANSIIARSLTPDGIGAPVSVFEGNDGLILTAHATADDGVYISGMTDGTTRLFYSTNGKDFNEVMLPFAGGELLSFGEREDGKGIILAYSGWLSNSRTISVENGKAVATDYASSTWEGARNFTIDTLQAKSADGTMVPLVVVRPGGGLPKVGMPTILEGYGGYGYSTATPAYARDFMAWNALGGAIAYCGIRGGGERGRAWHEAGRGPNKPNGHADFIACAETLKAKGYAPPKGVVATGTSMGGALVPPAVLKRPDLFAGMIPRVAIMNATRIGAAPNGANQFDEMGDPATPEGFASLFAMDAYQMLPSATTIPPTLITIGLNDKRVAPWISAKFAARAKAKFGITQQILLRADDDSGHGVGSAEDARLAERADGFAWAWAVSQ